MGKLKKVRKPEDGMEITYTAKIFEYFIITYDRFLNPEITAGPLFIAVSEKPPPEGFTIEDMAEILISDKHLALCKRNYEIILHAHMRNVEGK